MSNNNKTWRARAEDEWDTGDANNKKSCIEKCPEIEESDKTLILSKKVQTQIRTLCNMFKNLEWLGGLKGHMGEERVYISELQIFEQEVQGAYVELTDKGAEDINKTEGIIGWIHSHNTMNVFFSGTDIGTSAWNQISVVVNNRGDAIAKGKTKLTCGREALVDMKIELQGVTDDKETQQQAKKLIIEKAKQEITTPKDAKQSKQRKLEELEEIGFQGQGWRGICSHCTMEVTPTDESCFVDGQLFHAECVGACLDGKTERDTDYSNWRYYN